MSPPARARFRITAHLLGGLLVAATGLGVLDQGFRAGNRQGWLLPRFDVEAVPYHAPRFTRNSALLAARRPAPTTLLTGDSRTFNGLDPASLAAAWGRPPGSVFNFCGGGGLVSEALDIFLPHLASIDRVPREVIFGVAPEWPLVPKGRERFGDLYRRSLAYRCRNPETDPGLEAWMQRQLATRVALVAYRRDLVEHDLRPRLRCLLRGDCWVQLPGWTGPRLHWQDYDRRLAEPHPLGFEPNPLAGRTDGLFHGPARFTAEREVDVAALRALVQRCRQEGIRPIFVALPLHSSFLAVHQDAMRAHNRVLEPLLAELGTPLVRFPVELEDPSNWVDGHHATPEGAARLSAALGRFLAAREARDRAGPPDPAPSGTYQPPPPPPPPPPPGVGSAPDPEEEG